MNPDHPLHRASYYLELLKYGEGPKLVESVPPERFAKQVDTLLKEAGIADVTTGEALIEEHRFYAESFVESLGPALGRAPLAQVLGSIFLDGLLHGIALAGRLEAEPPS